MPPHQSRKRRVVPFGEESLEQLSVRTLTVIARDNDVAQIVKDIAQLTGCHKRCLEAGLTLSITYWARPAQLIHLFGFFVQEGLLRDGLRRKR